jgi:hypothetical protein
MEGNMGLRDKLKKSIQSSKVQVSDKAMDKLKSSLVKKSSFKTPTTKSEISNFEQKITKNLLDNPGDIGNGSNFAKNFIKDQLDSNMEGLINKTKDKLLKDINSKVSAKIKKSSPLGSSSRRLTNIIGGGNQNQKNNPAFKAWNNSYNQKPETLSSFVVSGVPYIMFEAKDKFSVDSEEFKNNIASTNDKVTGFNAGTKNADKKIKIPVSSEFMKTGYSFGYDEKSRLREASDVLNKSLDFVVDNMPEYVKSAARIGNQYRGIAVNPNMENAFIGVDFRKLSFNFELIPRNEEQSKEIDKIVYLLKYYSHPSKGNIAGVKSLSYPAQWIISYHNGSNGTPGVAFKTKECYCTSLSVEYGSSNGYLLFSDGRPTSVRISLSFTENEYITREDIGNETNGGMY